MKQKTFDQKTHGDATHNAIC